MSGLFPAIPRQFPLKSVRIPAENFLVWREKSSPIRHPPVMNTGSKRQIPKIVELERNVSIMKWLKRTAALLAPLLLLSMAVQAKNEAGAASFFDRLAFAAGEEDGDLRKLPVLPSSPEEDVPELPVIRPESGGIPELPVIRPAPPAAEETPELTVVTPKAAQPEAGSPPPEAPLERPASPKGPLFPEAEAWQLLLVNPWNEIPEDYEVTLKALSDGHKVDERAYDDLIAMLEDCRDAGLRPKICSSYRTQAKQTYLYNNKITRLRNAGYSKAAAQNEAGRWVARPGTSEHQLGLALDIVSSSYQALTKKQEKTAEQKWLMEHCWEYGFILRYPNEKSEITGIGYEPWHYRYVGRDVALDIRDSGLCLEEYLLLREKTLAADNWA